MAKVTEQYTFDPGIFFQLIVQPSFAGVFPEYTGIYNGGMEEFQVNTKVKHGVGSSIIDLRPNGTILQRKGATCKTNWQSMFKSGNRKIYVEELYGAVQDCLDSFFIEGAKDMPREQIIALRKALIVSYMKKMVSRDIFTNTYFGDVTRDDDATGEHSWNMFDGIFKKYTNYVGSGAYDSPTPIALPSGTITPVDAYNYLNEFVSQMPKLLVAYGADIMIRIDYGLALAYQEYLIASGNGSFMGPDFIQNGVPVMSIKGYPIYVERRWDVPLATLNGGTEAHCILLTLRNNFVWGTNNEYGTGPNLDQAFRVWWDDNEEMWKYKMVMSAGTEIIAPQFSMLGITDGILL